MRSNQYPTNKFEVLHITNPLTPRSDKHVTSPYNIYTLSSKQVVRLHYELKTHENLVK